MNNSFKMNKTKSHMVFPSPYQRPVPEATVGRSLQQSFLNVSQPGNSLRFSMNNAPFKRSFQNTNSTMAANQPMFLNNCSYNLMKMPSSSNAYSSIQDCSGDMPFHYEFQNYPQNSAEEYDGFMSDNNPYAYSMFDNGTKENMNTILDRNTLLPDKNVLLQGRNAVFQDRPSTPIAKSDQMDRFTIPENNNSVTIKSKDVLKDKTNIIKKENAAKPKKQEQEKSMRILSGTIEKVFKWQNIPESIEVLMEVIAPFVALGTSDRRGAKMILLRDQGTPVLQCIFYEIDRKLPNFTKGQSLRCVGKMVAKNKMWTFSIRAASPAEKAGFQRISFVSQRALTALELSTPEP